MGYAKEEADAVVQSMLPKVEGEAEEKKLEEVSEEVEEDEDDEEEEEKEEVKGEEKEEVKEGDKKEEKKDVKDEEEKGEEKPEDEKMEEGDDKDDVEGESVSLELISVASVGLLRLGAEYQRLYLPMYPDLSPKGNHGPTGADRTYNSPLERH